MAQILLFHHALGLTDGVRALAEQIEAGGHTVHTPDLYDGALFTDVEEGIAHVESLGGFDVIAERGMRAAAQHPQASVVAGIGVVSGVECLLIGGGVCDLARRRGWMLPTEPKWRPSRVHRR